MRFSASSTDEQRNLVRVAPRVFLIQDGSLLDGRRQGEPRREEYAPGRPARTLEAAGDRT